MNTIKRTTSEMAGGQRPTHVDQHHHLPSSPNSHQGQLPVVPMETRMRKRRGFASLAACAAICMALAACSSGHPNEASSPSTGNSSANDSDKASLLAEALPLELLLMPSEADYPILDDAVDLLTKECLAALGFSYGPYPPRPPRRLLDLRSRYGFLTVEDAASSGYRTTVPMGDPAEYMTEVGRIDSEREAKGEPYLLALYGPNGDGGCRADASMEIWGGPTGLISVPGFEDIVQLSVQSRDLLLHDEKALTVDNAWSSCMATHGYQYDSWVDAPAKFLLPGSEVSTREIEQATVDAQCRDTNDFERLLFDAETVIQDQLIAGSPLVQGFRERIRDAVERAKSYNSPD